MKASDGMHPPYTEFDLARQLFGEHAPSEEQVKQIWKALGQVGYPFHPKWQNDRHYLDMTADRIKAILSVTSPREL